MYWQEAFSNEAHAEHFFFQCASSSLLRHEISQHFCGMSRLSFFKG